MTTAITIDFTDIEFHPEFKNSRNSTEPIDELAASIKAQGLLQYPVVLKRKEEDTKVHYYLIIGFRRYAAIKKLRKEDPDAFKRIDVKPFEGTLAAAHMLNLTENVQREGLKPDEIGNAADRLLNLGYKQSEIATKIGKSQTWVSNALSMCRHAVPLLKEAVREGKVSYALGQQIATLDEKQQVRRTKEIIKAPKPKPGKPPADTASKVEETKMRKEIREASTRAIRPTTAEVRHEVANLDPEQAKNKLDDFQLGIWTSLKWILGERKTLRRPA